MVMYMAEIRVNRGIVVNVNDEGETIVVNVEDQCFIERFYAVLDNLHKASAEMNADSLKALEERQQINKLIETTREIMQDIDMLFGEGCCRKVFGDVVPSMYLIADFFDQLTPIAEQYIGKRKQFIEQKYNGNRKGCHSRKQPKKSVNRNHKR